MVVKQEMDALEIPYRNVELGEVEMAREIPHDKLEKLKAALLATGLEVMLDTRSVYIERIIAIVIQLVHFSDELPKVNLSDLLEQKLNMSYNYLSNLFTEVKGMTISQFVILHKVERIKELIIYDEFNLMEIARKMNYSSSAALSMQFKTVTGVTPTHFKKMQMKRSGIDKIGQ